MADVPDDAVALGGLRDLRDGELRCFGQVGAHGIVVCRVGGRLYALDDNCSHADTPLSEGRLRGHSLVCPLHGAAFDVRDGSHSGPPAWEGVVAHDIVEADGAAHVVLGRRPPRSGPTSADGSHQRTR